MKIIQSQETEYGICAYGKKTRFLNEGAGLGLDLVRRAAAIYPLIFQRPLGGIISGKEHTRVENLTTELSAGRTDERELRRLLDFEAFLQRRGQTGFVCPNGSRFYIDMGHPEYSCPETSNPLDALIAQKAGDAVVERCRKISEITLKEELKDETLVLDVNRANSDGKGRSYACHENYSLSPGLFGQIALRTYKAWLLGKIAMTFFSTRSVIIGAGKVGSDSGAKTPFQISQRADFIEKEISNLTTELRPIINSRDIPYADERIIRRFHVICGDSNMSHLSIYLKLGITSLFLMMLEDGFIKRQGSFVLTPLKNPVRSFRNVSRDLGFEHKVYFEDGSKRTALEIQKEFADLGEAFVNEKKLGPVWQDVAQKHKEVLRGLSGDRASHYLSKNLDWVIKEKLFEEWYQSEEQDPLSPECKIVDLMYHSVNPEESYYSQLEDSGELMTLVSREEIEEAIHRPFADTRAWLRGSLVGGWHGIISGIGWDYAFFGDSKCKMIDPRTCDVVFYQKPKPEVLRVIDEIKCGFVGGRGNAR